MSTSFSTPDFYTLFSGSAGNSEYLGTPEGGVLIDMGRSCRQMEQQLAKIGVQPEAVQAIFITHEHTDHCKGIKVWGKKYHTPVYASEGTLDALDEKGLLTDKFPAFSITDAPFDLNPMTVTPFPTSHDCAEGMGFRFDFPNDTAVSIISDTGEITEEIRETVAGTTLLYCENDYNTDLLWCGKYPAELKARIDSPTGHLSTAQVGQYARELVESETPPQQIVLGHLSEHNNDPEITERLVKLAVQDKCQVAVAQKEVPMQYSIHPEISIQKGEILDGTLPTQADEGVRHQDAEELGRSAGQAAPDHPVRVSAEPDSGQPEAASGPSRSSQNRRAVYR